jgi:hypothetical protein
MRKTIPAEANILRCTFMSFLLPASVWGSRGARRLSLSILLVPEDARATADEAATRVSMRWRTRDGQRRRKQLSHGRAVKQYLDVKERRRGRGSDYYPAVSGRQ